MSKLFRILSALISVLFTACASSSLSKSSQGVVKSPQILEIERKKKEREESVQDLKDRRLVLARKSALPQSSPNVVVAPLIAPLDLKMSEGDLYAELVRSYDMNNEIRFFSRYQAFMRKYAQGPLADDAMYLAGLFSLSNKNYGPSLKYFNLILKQYPSSNKTSSALFGKGVALKKMNLVEESKLVLAEVQKKFPGSPEALRADGELKILNR